jgi:hypothetical protein
MHRRDFFRRTGLAAGVAACSNFIEARQHSAAIIVDDPLTTSRPVQWAVNALECTFKQAGWGVTRRDKPQAGELNIVAATAHPKSIFPTDVLPPEPESCVLFESDVDGARCLVALGRDARGLTYALSEIADRVQHGRSLEIEQPIVERPANPVRSVMRQFTSELLDKPWFYDRDGWTQYLDLLASQRWNRLDLAFGFGYDSLNRVDDSYFLFFYPFVVSVPGYNVRATNLPDSERERNLETLQFISHQTVLRGMDFQLGIWMHGYRWAKGNARNIIEGLTPETHAAYCRDALTTVLQKCPAVSSVGLRIHGESGIAEGSYDFWTTIFEGVRRCGRIVEIDLHAKGLDEKMIGNALATGMPVNVSPKYSAEHFGMPYHQAAIRKMEMPVAGHTGAGLMTISEGARVFTRYGYADFLREDRKYTVRHRVFSGTQRILLWDDPASTAAYARAFQFCGSAGADLMEPLTCRGRRGSAVPGRRTGYVDARLEPKWDWQKYTNWYRVWGRLMYNPDTDSDVFRRENSGPLDPAVAKASRILPIVTTAYLPSAACDAYWPEIYWNQPMVSEPKQNPYGDTLAPKVFQNASPLDPELFSSMAECANELVQQRRSGKYSPIETAQWLDRFASEADTLQRSINWRLPLASRRVRVDVNIQAGLGRFFAHKFRAGVLYAIYEMTQDRRALEQTLACYRAARDSWASVVSISSGVYAADLSCSDRFDERGQWSDRLALIDSDISELQRQLASATTQREGVDLAINEVLSPTLRPSWKCRHAPPSGFRRGSSLLIELTADGGEQLSAVTLHYRHVNQSARYQTAVMEPAGGPWRAAIAPDYTDSPYPLQYYFELRESSARVYLYPGFDADPINQPYFAVRQSRDSQAAT